jgi:hypothetical protein
LACGTDVRSRVQREVGQKFALGFGQLAHRFAGRQLDAQFRSVRAQRIAIARYIFDFDPASVLKRFESALGQRDFPLESGCGQRSRGQHRDQPAGGIRGFGLNG